MKLPLSAVVGAAALTFALGATACQSTPTKQTLSEAEMMAKWTEFATPGAGHQALNHKVGRWNLKVKMYMTPGAPPVESTGTSETRWIMDGRYLEDDTLGSAMGQPFVGHGLSGYDNLTGTYTGVWIDNMGTGLMTSEGTYDPKTRTFHFTSQSPDVGSGKYIETRVIEKVIDDDHWTMQMFGPDPDGKEYMMMEIEYSRR
jgi:hypothetical protein